MNGKGDIRPRKRKEKESRKDDDDFTRVLNARATAAHLRNLALREVQKTPNQNLKIRKLARTVLETVFSKKDRGAGSWSELAEREPILIQKLCSTLKKCRKLQVARGEVRVIRKGKGRKK